MRLRLATLLLAALALLLDTPAGAQSIGASQHHTCATSAPGELYCWGRTTWGAAARDGLPADSVPLAPVRAAAGARFAQVAAGWLHDCAVMVSGSVFCDGVGAGAAAVRPSADAAHTPRFRTVTAGQSHTCALATDGAAYCWGDNDAGQTGIGSRAPTVDRPTPVVGGHRFRQLSAGERHTCGITRAGATLCWGANTFGQLGRDPALRGCAPTEACMAVPAPLDDRRAFVAVAAGAEHTCALTRAGQVYCWGRYYSRYSQTAPAAAPLRLTRVGASIPFRSLSAGLRFTCGIAGDARAYCWSIDPLAAVGRELVRWGCEGADLCLDEAPVSPVIRFRSVAAGHHHACGIGKSGAVYCWGVRDVRVVGHARTAAEQPPLCGRLPAGTDPRCAEEPFRVLVPNLLDALGRGAPTRAAEGRGR
jgi:alpha-tubulin suppressor-like RCC1 family protein